MRKTCNDAIMSWADPKDTFTCHFPVSMRKGCYYLFREVQELQDVLSLAIPV